RLAELDLHVHVDLRLGVPRVTEDRPGAERARAELHAPGEVPDGLSLLERLRDEVGPLLALAHAGERRAIAFEHGIDLVRRVGGPEVAPSLRVPAVLAHVARDAEPPVRREERGA